MRRYQEIGQALLGEIRSGVYEVEDQLPSENELADRFNVSRPTARQALSLLERKGVVRREQGRGTFVSDVNRLEEGRSSAADRHVVFVVAEQSADDRYTLPEIMAAERVCAPAGFRFSCATVKAEELILGNLPPVLRGPCSGILLDGHVNDMVIHLLRRLQVPIVVAGTHRVSSSIPQVRASLDEMTMAACRQLASVADQPVAYIGDLYQYHFCQDIVEGYRRVLPEINQQASYLYHCPNDVLTDEVDRLYRASNGRFSLVILNKPLLPVLDAYRRLGISPITNPICFYTSFNEPLPNICPEGIWTLSLDPQDTAQRAAKMLMRLMDNVEGPTFEDPSYPLLSLAQWFDETAKRRWPISVQPEAFERLVEAR